MRLLIYYILTNAALAMRKKTNPKRVKLKKALKKSLLTISSRFRPRARHLYRHLALLFFSPRDFSFFGRKL
jgi:hypothetical protein